MREENFLFSTKDLLDLYYNLSEKELMEILNINDLEKIEDIKYSLSKLLNILDSNKIKKAIEYGRKKTLQK